jgi:hypothetical protein
VNGAFVTALATVLLAAPDLPAPARSRVALVVRALPSPEPGRLAATREQLGQKYFVLDQARLRVVLEGFARAPAPEELVRRALLSAAQQLRRFDTTGADRTLSEARQAALSLQPTDEGRDLVAQVAQQEALLGLLKRDIPGQRRAMAVALSARPALQPDPDAWPPALIELLKETRARQAASPKVTVEIESTPAGATVITGTGTAGLTPVTLIVASGSPFVVWLARSGYAPRCERIEPDSPRASLALERMDEEHRFGPLVDALRAAEAAQRPTAARALAEALEIDAIALWDGLANEPVVYEARPPAVALSPPALGAALLAERELSPPWYRDPLGDSLLGGAVVGAGLTAVAFGVGQSQALATYSGTSDGMYQAAKTRSAIWREGATLTAISTGALFAGALLRYALHRAPNKVSAGLAAGPASGAMVISAALP